MALQELQTQVVVVVQMQAQADLVLSLLVT
jgi:hypothetical protein